MSEMHDLIMYSTTKILKDNCTKEQIDAVEEGIWPKDLWKILVDSGIPTIAVPNSLGGTGGDFFDAFHILRLAGKFAVPLPLSETLITNWLLAEQGESPLNEPLTFSIQPNHTLKIEPIDDGYVISGTVENVPWARLAKKMLVISQINNQDMIALLPLKDAKFKRNSNLAGEPLDTVTYNKTKVDLQKAYPIIKEAFIKHTLHLGALTRAAMMSGALEKILELTIQYTKEREQFGRPLSKHQAIQQYISIITGEVAASLMISNKAIASFGQGDYEDKIANAKLSINESAGIVSDIAHQVHGAIGVTHEHQLHQLTRRLWSWRDDFGNENDWAEQLANNIMNSNTSSLWDDITK